MLRKLSAIVAYTVVVVAVTVFTTQSKKEAPTTTAQAIQALQRKFQENPPSAMKEVETVCKSAMDLQNDMFDYKLAAADERLSKLFGNLEQLKSQNNRNMILAREAVQSLEEAKTKDPLHRLHFLITGTNDQCACGLDCDCPTDECQCKNASFTPGEAGESMLQQKNNKKRRALNLLFGTSLETEDTLPCDCTEDCQPKGRFIPDEVDPTKVIEVHYEAGLAPLPPSID